MPDPAASPTSSDDVLQAGEDLLEQSRALLREVDDVLLVGQHAAGTD